MMNKVSVLVCSAALTIATSAAALEVPGEVHFTPEFGIPGDLICQDGQDFFFKDVKACEKIAPLAPATIGLQCDDLTIGPINEVEEIFAKFDHGRVDYIWRFFSVSTKYDVDIYARDEKAKGRPYRLEKTVTREVPVCENMVMLEPVNAFSTHEATVQQKYLIKQLVKKNLLIINSPYANLTDINYVERPERAVSSQKLPAPKAKKAFYSGKPGSPFCNKDVSNEHILWLMGVRGGGGVSEFRASSLQGFSTGLSVKPLLTEKDWHQLSQKPFDESIEAYSISCDSDIAI